jgi:hypothetical protein
MSRYRTCEMTTTTMTMMIRCQTCGTMIPILVDGGGGGDNGVARLRVGSSSCTGAVGKSLDGEREVSVNSALFVTIPLLPHTARLRLVAATARPWHNYTQLLQPVVCHLRRTAAQHHPEEH